MSSVETLVEGAPSSILSIAAWLRDSMSAGSAVMDESVYRQYRQVAAAWEGDSADGLRGRLSTLTTGAETLSTATASVARALESLGAVLEGVQADMASARSQAVAGGLTVSGTVIYGPSEPPAVMAELTPNAKPVHVAAYNRDLATLSAYEASRGVWDEVVEIVDAARGRWETAVEAAEQTWGDNAGNLAGLVSGLVTAGASGVALATVAYSASLLRDFHLQSAADYAAHLQAVTTGGRITTSAAHYYELMDSAALHTDGAALLAQEVRTPRLPANLGRGLLIIGVAATGYAIYDDIQHGESPAQAAVSNGAGFAASMLAGAGIGAAVGSVIPVGGTIVGGIVGAVGGAAVGIITSGMIDSMWENGVDSGGDVLNALADGWDEMIATGVDAGELVGDAAGVLGGGIEDAWNAIF